MDGTPAWDYFLSYTQADRAWAEWIAWELEETGKRVLVQAWDFVPGTNWVNRMQDGVTEADRTIAVLSEAYLDSVYGSAEWHAAWTADPRGQDRKLLMVRVADCPRPGLLAGMVSGDLFGVPEDKARIRLQQMIKGAETGRVKPDQRPGFPGAARAIPRQPRFPAAQPTVWKVPARNPHFTGRVKQLQALTGGFSAGATVTVHSLHGMGGVGKTQLAIEYAHVHATGYDLVWWIDAEQTALIPGQFAALAEHLGVSAVPDPDTVREAVHAALRQVPRWLLVFDNADDVTDLRAWIPPTPPGPGQAGHVLVTTRRGDYISLGTVVDLDVMTTPEAVQLLRRRLPDIDQDTAALIAAELDGLPLALEQAAAYMTHTLMPAPQYLDLWRARSRDLHHRGHPDHHRDTIATLWQISLDRIRRESPAAVQLLGICAHLAPEPIPLDLFTRHGDRLPQPLATAAGDPLTFNDALAVLVDYSLAKRTPTHTPTSLQMHRLVQDVIRASPNHTGDIPTGQDPMNTPHPQPPPANPLLTAAVGILRDDAPGQIMGAPQDWPRWQELLPHVLTVTTHPDLTDVSTTTGQDHEVGADLAWLLDRAATYLQVRGQPAAARPLAERALTITEAALGPDHPTVATHLGNLALILQDLGQAAAARPLAERALTITEAALGPDHPTVATHLGNLALILRDLGQATAARPLAERALTITEAALGPDHPDLAARLGTLAWILADLGQAAAARPLAERALTITEAALGPDHPDLAIRLAILAWILADLGQAAAARPLAERALTITEAALGPDHPDLAIRLGNLAWILRDLGQAAAARPLAERALAITEATLGPDHPDLAIRLGNLAWILRDLGQAAAARPLAERALAITEATLGPDHPDLATRLGNLASILADLGQAGQARPLAERALAITEATLRPDHPTTLWTRAVRDDIAAAKDEEVGS